MTETEEWQKKAIKKYRGAVSRSQGLLHEKMIEAGCIYYRQTGRAYIVKEPEPFRVLKKDKRTGRATIQFVKHAQPDFHGTLKGGRTIVFEAKHTNSDRIKQDLITPEQAASLTVQERLGAAAFVCAGIDNRAFMVPWSVWSDMKKYFGRKYATADDLEPFEVVQDMSIKFLEYKE